MLLPWRLAAAVAAFLVLGWSGGCGSPPPPPQAPPAQGPDTAIPEERVFFLGRIPFLTATEVVRSNEGLIGRLASGLGVDRVTMVLAPSYDGVLDLLLAGKVDAAWLGTDVYRDAVRRKRPVEALAVPSRNGRTWYEGVVVCRADSGFMALSDLKGRRFAFVDPHSSSGYVAPKALLEASGLKVPGDFVTRESGRPDFLGKHDNVVLSVYFGKMDAGAVYDQAIEETFKNEPTRQAELMALARTGRIPNEPIVVRADLPSRRKERIVAAFLGLEIRPEEQAIFGGVERFLPYSEEPPAGR